MYRLVSDDARAFAAAITNSANQSASPYSFLRSPTLEPLAFYVLSASGSYHPPHFDSSGFHTIIGCMDGYKLLIIVLPFNRRAKTPPHILDAWILLELEDAYVIMIVLKPGEFV